MGVLRSIAVLVCSFLVAMPTAQTRSDKLRVVLTNSTLPVAVYYSTAVYDGDDAVYILGGVSIISYNQLTKYTLSTGNVQVIGIYKKAQGGAILMDNADIIHIGGFAGLSERFAAIDRMSTRSGMWEQVNSLPKPMDGVHAAWDREAGVAYLFGGQDDDGFRNSVLMYKPSVNDLSEVGRLPEARGRAATAWDPRQKVAYIFGGNPSPGARDILTFNSTSGLFTKLQTKLPHQTRYPVAVYVEHTGEIIIIDPSGVVSFDTRTQVAQLVPVDFKLERPAVVYVPKLARVYIFGGGGSYGDQPSTHRNEIAYIDFDGEDVSTTASSSETTVNDPSTKQTTATSTEEPTEPPSTVCPGDSSDCEAGEEGVPSWLVLVIPTAAILFYALTSSIWLVRRRRKLKTTKLNNRLRTSRLKTILYQFPTGGASPKPPHEVLYDESRGSKNFSGALGTQYDRSRYEIPNGSLSIDKNMVLGSGQFGVVFKGTLCLSYDSMPREQIVAVKRLKADHLDDSDSVTSLLKELKVMIHVGAHDNVLRLLGACTVDVENLCLVLEYCEHGSLRNYLVANRGAFGAVGPSPTAASYVHMRCSSYSGSLILPDPSKTLTPLGLDDLLRWTLQMAAGMEYLAARKVIHGDLALRNVLLDGKRMAKVSDFGLGSRLYEYALYAKKTEQKLLPWRWMAPETLTELRFSYASDVWAFGVAAWELFSLGCVPYPGCGWAPSFVEQLLGGYRNARPEVASEEVYSLMMSCWATEAAERPSMTEIRERLTHALIAKESISGAHEEAEIQSQVQ